MRTFKSNCDLDLNIDFRLYIECPNDESLLTGRFIIRNDMFIRIKACDIDYLPEYFKNNPNGKVYILNYDELQVFNKEDFFL